MTSASGDNCHAEFYIKGNLIIEFNTLRLLQMGALIGPMFLSASLCGSFNEEMYCRQGSTSFLLLVFSHF